MELECARHPSPVSTLVLGRVPSFLLNSQSANGYVGFQRVWDESESANKCGENEEQTPLVCGYAQTGTLTMRQPL